MARLAPCHIIFHYATTPAIVTTLFRLYSSRLADSLLRRLLPALSHAAI